MISAPSTLDAIDVPFAISLDRFEDGGVYFTARTPLRIVPIPSALPSHSARNDREAAIPRGLPVTPHRRSQAGDDLTNNNRDVNRFHNGVFNK